MEAIYERYRRRETSFEMTLLLLQDLLNERLRPEFRRIWVQGSNSGRSRLCFTIFTNSGYDMRFIEVGSLRQFRSDGNLPEEIVYIERLLESFRTGVLLELISSI
jgi:hypothetical protein